MFNCNVYLSNSDQLWVDGVINFENSAAVMQQGIKLINHSKIINLNLINLKHSDSSGLAVISAWIRFANKHNKILQIYNMPKFLIDLGKISNLGEVFPVVMNAGTN